MRAQAARYWLTLSIQMCRAFILEQVTHACPGVCAHRTLSPDTSQRVKSVMIMCLSDGTPSLHHKGNRLQTWCRCWPQP